MTRPAVHLTLVPRDPQRADGGDPWAALLLSVAQARDRQAFSQLFTHFAPRVKSWLARTGSSEQQAEELAQEALVTVWRKAELFDPAQSAVSTWIFSISRNLRIDAGRRHRPEVPVDGIDLDAIPDEQPEAAERLDASRLALRVRDAIQQLPPEQALVLRLSYYEDEPQVRIAAELGIPLGTVKSRVRLALAQLRRLMEPRERTE